MISLNSRLSKKTNAKCCSDASGWLSLEHSLGQKPACIQLRGACDPRGQKCRPEGGKRTGGEAGGGQGGQIPPAQAPGACQELVSGLRTGDAELSAKGQR